MKSAYVFAVALMNSLSAIKPRTQKNRIMVAGVLAGSVSLAAMAQWLAW